MANQPTTTHPHQSGGDGSGTAPLTVERPGAYDGKFGTANNNQQQRNDSGKFLAKTEFWLATGTWALVIVTLIIVCDAREAIERGQRAWLAPKQMLLNGVIPGDGGLNVILRIENIGKEPATRVAWHTTDPFLTDLIPERDSQDTPGPSNDNTSCSGIRVDKQGGLVIYPTIDPRGNVLPFSLPLSANSKTVIAAAKALNGSMFVDGCIAYWTSGETHTSRFRFLWRSVKGADPKDWAFQAVNSGNHAD